MKLFLRITTAIILSQSLLSAGGERVGLQRSSVYTFQDQGTPIPPEERERIRFAVSKLRRSTDDVCMTVITRDLEPGAYTNWWVIFNNPDQCGDGSRGFGKGFCSADDLSNPAVEPSIIWGAGGLVGPDGAGYFNNCIEVGGAPGEIISGQGLLNYNAEIHVLIRTHDTAAYDNPLVLGEQLTTLAGGCGSLDPSGVERACSDPQVVIHPPLRKLRKR